MATGSDPIKRADQALRIQAAAYKAVVAVEPEAWNLTAAGVLAFGAALTNYTNSLTAQTAALDNAHAATASKDAFKDVLTEIFRAQYRTVKADPEVTDAMLESAQLPPRDDTRSPVPAPSVVPAALLERSDRLSQTIRIIDAANPTRRGKADGVAGYRVYYKVGPVAPTSTRDCAFAGQFGKSTVVVPFEPGDGGKQVWYIVVAVNPVGQEGPMSEVLETTIAA